MLVNAYSQSSDLGIHSLELSTVHCIPLPQDEDYARQLQFEFETSSQGDVPALLQPSLMVSTACEAQAHMSRRGSGSHVDKGVFAQ